MINNQIKQNNNDDSNNHNLFHHFCLRQNALFIDINVLKNKYWTLHEMFLSADENWINLKLLTKLFPNLEHLVVRNLYFDAITLQNILYALSQDVFASNENRLNQILLEETLYTQSDVDLDILLNEFNDDILLKVGH